MGNPSFLQETKQHGAVRFPFNIYPCTIPGDFPQVALHWQDSMELVFAKKGRGIVQAGLTSYTAAAGDIYVFAPGVLHALRFGIQAARLCKGRGKAFAKPKRRKLLFQQSGHAAAGIDDRVGLHEAGDVPGEHQVGDLGPVSYTHLTLPTNSLV